MKRIYTTTIFCLFVLLSFSQKKAQGYIGPVATMAIDGGIGLSAGGYYKIKSFTVGAGYDFIKLKNYNGAYGSVYGEVRFYVLPGLFINGQGGYSFMSSEKNTTAGQNKYSIKSEGGIYYAGGAGYEFKGKKVAPFISLKAAYYTLNITNTAQVLVGTAYRTTITEKDLSELAPTITIGIKF